jgi:hypothetical protein
MPKDAQGALISKDDQIKATQNLVDKRILAPLTLVRDNGKGNPLRNKSVKKRRNRAVRELSKFDDELLRKIPPEKLTELLDKQSLIEDTEWSDQSFKEEVDKLLRLASGKVNEEPPQTEVISAKSTSQNAGTQSAQNFTNQSSSKTDD